MSICRISACPLIFLISLGGLSDFGTGQLAAGEVTDFFNVIAPQGADPWVWRHEGRYLATVTTGRDIVLIRSPHLSTLGAGERKVVWSPSKGSPVAKNLWAPEIHRLGDAWYLYVAADDGENANHRMYVLENKAADPFDGEFQFKAQIRDTHDDRWAIDGTPFQVGDQLYFVWSGWEGNEDVRQNLYLAPMSNPWTLSGPRVEISRPSLPWEVQGAPPTVNEGPQVLIRGPRIHLIYSASGSWTDSYCLGMLTASLEGNLLSSKSWTKHDRPVFSSAHGVYGPGHCSFVKSPDGAEDWIVYHAACYQGAGWGRLIRSQPFRWDASGLPRFGSPVAPDRAIPIPGGEPARLRYEAEAAELVGDARLSRGLDASQGASVRLMRPGASANRLTVDAAVGTAGAYVMTIRFRHGSEGRTLATQGVIVNDGPEQLVSYRTTGLNGWSNAFVTARFNTGRNRIRFESKIGDVELDCLDLVPIHFSAEGQAVSRLEPDSGQGPS